MDTEELQKLCNKYNKEGLGYAFVAPNEKSLFAEFITQWYIDTNGSSDKLMDGSYLEECGLDNIGNLGAYKMSFESMRIFKTGSVLIQDKLM